MSRWSDEFENHPIHQLLNQATEYLGADIKDTDAAFEDERRRLRNVLGSLREIVSELDHEFYPKQWLDQIHDHFSQHVLNQLQAYSNNPTIAQLHAANNQVTAQAPQIYYLAAMSRPQESQEIITNAQKAFGSFTSSIEAKANETDERVTNCETELTAISEKAEVLEQQLEAVDTSAKEKLSEWQEDFTSKQTTRAEEHSIAQIERDEKFTTTSKEQQEKFGKERADTLNKQNARFDTAFDNFKLSGEDAGKDIKEKQTAIRKLHGLVTDETVAGGYHRGAKDEKIEADRWRIRSLIFLCLAVLWLGVRYFIGLATTAESTINWPDIITVTSLTAILLYAASYTSRQSTMHRNNEKLLRSYALETQALDPFIASLKSTDQQAIKAELVRRMFGQQNAQGRGKSGKLDDDTLKTLLDKMSDTFTDAFDKVINKK